MLFSTLFLVLGNVVKHGFSYLIHYFADGYAIRVKRQAQKLSFSGYSQLDDYTRLHVCYPMDSDFSIG